MRWFALLFVLGTMAWGCDDTPSGDDMIMPLEDQRVRVNDTLVIDLRVRNVVGGEQWSYSAPSVPDIERTAGLFQSGGTAVFRWAPLASHAGTHQITFTVSSSAGTDSETINVEVVQAGGAPRFIQPPPGGTYDIEQTACIDVDIEVIDEDSTEVTIRERSPGIEGGEMRQTDSHRARWHWCPTPAQVDASLRYTLHLEADDGEHPPVRQNYDIVLLTDVKPDCPGETPVISGISPAQGARLETIQDYEVVARVEDAEGLKSDPVLYYSTTEPNGGRPDVTRMDLVTFSLGSDGLYHAYIPNLELEASRDQTVYYVISATDNDDPDGAGCDHTVLSTVNYFIASEPAELDQAGFCHQCSSDRQCGGGLCVVPDVEGARSFCGQDCSGGSCEEGICSSITSRGGSVDDQCVPEGMRCDGLDCVNDAGEPDNDAPDTAPTVTLGVSSQGQICPGDLDIWNVDLEAGVSYQVWLEHTDAERFDIDAYLFTPEGELIGIGEDVTGVESFTVCADTAGLHSIIVVGARDADQASYELWVTEEGGDCCVDDDNEPDDFIDEATTLAFDTLVEGQICPGDEDWWQVRITEPTTLTVEMLCDAGDFDLDVQLYDSELTRLAQSIGLSCEELLTATLPEGGNYYIRVFGVGLDEGYYLLEARAEAGAACADTHDCPAGTVCDPSEGCVDEVCTSPGDPGDCPSGHFCPEPGGFAAQSVCAVPCITGAECRGGYECKTFAERRGCAPAGAGGPGAPCDSFADCAGEQICLTSLLAGYCSELGCATLEDCPEGSFCVDVSGGAGETACLRDCFDGDERCNETAGECDTTVDTEGFVVYACVLPEQTVP